MSSVPIQEDELLRTQISQTHEKLSGLERDLRAIDGELESLAAQRVRYELLERLCGSLEELDELGGGELFWGQTPEAQVAEHVRQVRGKVGVFHDRIEAIEQRRHALLDKIKDDQEVLDILEYDLLEIEEEEEERQQEWVPEREEIDLPARRAIMPWSRSGEDDWRYRKALSVSLLVALVLGMVVPWIDLPLPDLQFIPEVPERLARLVREQEPPPPPPPAAIEEPIPEEEPLEPELEEPVVAEEQTPEVPQAIEEPAPTVAEEPAPEAQVRSAGILAFRESFANLADNRPAAQLGSQARINDAGESAVGRTERSMVTSQAPGSSGGINLASLSRDVGGAGGQGIDGVQVSRVASSIGPAGNGSRPLASGAVAGRTDEEIQIVFDRYKAALYRLYNRELRNDPTLRGQVVLQLTIEPDGSVSFCEVQSSDMGAPTLEQQVVERVLTFDFGAKADIPAITILYPIDFLPAA